MNLRRLSKRLQTALCQKGIQAGINQFQHYSKKSGRMVTKFVVSAKKDGEKSVTICESYQMADVVIALAGLLTDNDGGDG